MPVFFMISTITLAYFYFCEVAVLLLQTWTFFDERRYRALINRFRLYAKLGATLGAYYLKKKHIFELYYLLILVVRTIALI